MTDTVSAINYIKSYRKLDEELHKNAPKGSRAYYATKLGLEYWDAAIQALEQTQLADGDRAVSLNAVLEQTYNWSKDEFLRVTNPFHYLRKRINSLPPVTPSRPTGHWITQWNAAHQKEYYYCSKCREEFSYDGETGIKMNDYDFCPNCGAKMFEPQESEE